MSSGHRQSDTFSIRRCLAELIAWNSSQKHENADEIRGLLGLRLLFEPFEPLVDFVFVHGLGGGSRKIWSKTSSPQHFWPKAWLPQDPAFKHARLRSYGYNADWIHSRDGGLNIHDFAKALVAELWDSPCLKTNGRTSIILIGHSMGGLVIKKAYMLARQDPSYQPLAERIFGLLFLGTPHRGSDSAKLLSNVLRVSFGYSSKPYVEDLKRGSGALEAINDEFRHYADQLRLRSFYETLKTQLGWFSQLIVNKDSATLGYPNEQSSLINADHSGLCKFDAPSDPNFVMVRNALASLLDEVTARQALQISSDHHHQTQRLRKYLKIQGRPEDDLLRQRQKRMEGTCQWVSDTSDFQVWLAGKSPVTNEDDESNLPYSMINSKKVELSNPVPRYYLLHGQPAAGKSVLAAYVIDKLDRLQCDCSYFFFRCGEEANSALSGCLRSLAYQMAEANPAIRKRLLLLEQHRERMDKMDQQAIWRKLFLNVIFQEDNLPIQYWVIDGLDERDHCCELAAMLAAVPQRFPLRVFVTSRLSGELKRSFSPMRQTFASHQLSIEDTLSDIKHYIKTRAGELPMDDAVSQAALVAGILEKAAGCFLWVNLVMDQLSHAYTLHDIRDALKDIPPDMDLLYERILNTMSKSIRGRQLIKSVLKWTVCAKRLLNVSELALALKIDIGHSVRALRNMIESECGDLVRVDQFGKIHLIHQTVREYLLRADLESELSVNVSEGHSALARTCLLYLGSKEMKPPNRPHQLTCSRFANRSVLAGYAACYFSEHVRRADPCDKELLSLLDDFLDENVLSWIEHVARCGELDLLTGAANNMKTYLMRRAKFAAPLSKQVQRIEQWISDLVRLAAKFGPQLLECPQAIYSLIPAFCPLESALAMQFSGSASGHSVHGISNYAWDDRLLCVDYPMQANAVTCSIKYFAVGLASGMITISDLTTCQKVKQIEHPEAVRQLEFSDSGTLLACSGASVIQLWSVGYGHQIWQHQTTDVPLALTFAERDHKIIAATRSNELLTWQTVIGDHEPVRSSFSDERVGSHRVPDNVALSIDLNIMAVVRRGQPIRFKGLEEHQYFGSCVKTSDATTGDCRGQGSQTLVAALVLNRNPMLCLLAVAYFDGDLAIFDPCDSSQKNVVENAHAHTLASSSNGRLLATGSSIGTICLYEFETLKLLYYIARSELPIRAITFSNDDLSLIDIRGTQCNVWNPAILVEDRLDADRTESLSSESEIVGTTGARDGAAITALLAHGDGESLFCGTEHGSIYLYSATTGQELCMVSQHVKNIPIMHLLWGERLEILVSTDISSRFVVWKMTKSDGRWTTVSTLLDKRADSRINQVVLNKTNDFLLVSTSEEDSVWTMEGAKTSSPVQSTRGVHQWVNDPMDFQQLLFVTSAAVQVYDWNTMKPVSDPIYLRNSLPPRSIITRIFPVGLAGRKIALEYAEPLQTPMARRVLLLDLSQVSSHKICATLTSNLHDKLNRSIGVIGAQLIFFDHNWWVCSTKLVGSSETETHQRHSFIPNDWPSSNPHSLFCLSNARDLVFVKRHEVGIIKNALCWDV